MEIQETLEEAALRELIEETGLRMARLSQVHTFSALDRDPRGRVISTCFAAMLPEGEQAEIQAGSDAAGAGWFSLTDLPPLAFDHAQVIQTVVEKYLTPQQAQ